MENLYETGVRPAIDNFLVEEAKKVRDYGEYWSASSAGYCMRKVIFDRLGVDPVKEDARKQKVFTVGHIFHSWIQDITKGAGVSVAQELELLDKKFKIKGHIDDLILINGYDPAPYGMPDDAPLSWDMPDIVPDRLILYDYKTQHSRAFSYKKPGMSHYHRMQLGTYMMMLRDGDYPTLDEARILKISKDDLRMNEEVLYWDDRLENDVRNYWSTINNFLQDKKMPPCTCAEHEGGFMAKETYNPYYFNGEPCSPDWYKLWKERKSEQ